MNWWQRWRDARYRSRHPHAPIGRWGGLSESEFSRLAEYNTQRAKGIVYTPEVQAEMAELQKLFDGRHDSEEGK